MSGSGLEMTMTRKGQTLVPTAQIFMADLMTVPEGKEVFVVVRMARNPRQHRWFFGVLGQIVKSGTWDGDVNSLLDWIKVAVGHVSTVIHESGRVYHILKSISFASMDQLKFQRFVKRAEYYLAERLGIDVGEIFKRATDDSASEIDEQRAPPVGEPVADRRTCFENPSWERLMDVGLKLQRQTSKKGVEAAYEADKAEFAALVQLDRPAVSDVYQIALRLVRGDLEKKKARDMLNARVDQHAQEMERRN